MDTFEALECMVDSKVAAAFQLQPSILHERSDSDTFEALECVVGPLEAAVSQHQPLILNHCSDSTGCVRFVELCSSQ